MPVHKLSVEMTCEGCAKAVTRILNKQEGVTQVQCDVPNKLVTIQTESETLSATELANALASWAKAANKRVSIV